MDRCANDRTFPPEILRQFIRDRSTLAAFRCTCREFAEMTVAGRWSVRVETKYIYTFGFTSCGGFAARYDGSTPYAASSLWCPFSAEHYRVFVRAGGREWVFNVTTNDDSSTRPFAQRVAREFLLIEQDPLIPYLTVDGFIMEVLADGVKLESVEDHYAVVVEPPIWDSETAAEWHGFLPVVDENLDQCVVVTLLARASVIAADAYADTCYVD